MTQNTAFCYLDGSTILFLIHNNNRLFTMKYHMQGQIGSFWPWIQDIRLWIQKHYGKFAWSKFPSEPQTMICSLKYAVWVTTMNFKNNRGLFRNWVQSQPSKCFPCNNQKPKRSSIVLLVVTLRMRYHGYWNSDWIIQYWYKIFNLVVCWVIGDIYYLV